MKKSPVNEHQPAAEIDLTADKVAWLRSQLIAWYHQNLRPMPWRERSDAYGIWISEIMLQQTQVATVIDYYNAFMKQFPTIEELALADEEQVMMVWAGLGYYSRARHLHQTAQVIVREFAGNFPRDRQALLALPGIGEYTAGAIASIAFGLAVPAVDGNVMRVYARFFLIDQDIARPETKKYFFALGEKLVPSDQPSSFNQGLMELGALICTPQNPACSLCPLRTNCLAAGSDVQDQLPVKTKKAAPKTVLMEAALVYHQGKFLLSRRPEKGLLANLWALPSGESISSPGQTVKRIVEENFGLKLSQPVFVREQDHLFTHLRWRTRLYHLRVIEKPAADMAGMQWVSLAEAADLALPTAFQKLLPEVGEIIAAGQSSVSLAGKVTED